MAKHENKKLIRMILRAVDGSYLVFLQVSVFFQVVKSEKPTNILQSSNVSTQNLTPSPTLRVLRKVKGNLTCAQPGCAAEVMLQIYDPVEDGGKR